MTQQPPNVQSPPPAGPMSASDEKLWAMLSYLLSPLVPIFVLISDNMKNNPLLKYHAVQSIGVWVGEIVLSIIFCIVYFVCTAVSAGILGLCLWVLFFVPFLPQLYYAYLAYTNPTYFKVPAVTDFMTQQGWLPRA